MSSPLSSSPSYDQLVERWKLHELNVPKKGRGVFAGTSIPPQQLLLKFEGPVFGRETCPNFEESIQVRSTGMVLQQLQCFYWGGPMVLDITVQHGVHCKFDWIDSW